MLRILGWALLGAVIGGAVAFGAGLFWLSYINTDNREGAAAMGVAFVITPFGALIGTMFGALLGGLRRR